MEKWYVKLGSGNFFKLNGTYFSYGIEGQIGITANVVRANDKQFESPRGRGRGNPGWGRLNGLPFVSQRGRRRIIPSGPNHGTKLADIHHRILCLIIIFFGLNFRKYVRRHILKS